MGIKMIELLQMRIKEIETALEQSAVNHGSLMVRLDEAKQVLEMVTKAADAIAPQNNVTKALDSVNEIVNS